MILRRLIYFLPSKWCFTNLPNCLSLIELLIYNSHIINHIYLKCTTWNFLTYIYIHQTLSQSRKINMSMIPQSFLMSLCTSSLLLLATNEWFSLTIALFIFAYFYTNGTWQYVVIFVCFLSLSILVWISIHVVWCSNFLFLFTVEWKFIVWTDILQFICWPIDGRLRCFWFSAVANKSSISNHTICAVESCAFISLG